MGQTTVQAIVARDLSDQIGSGTSLAYFNKDDMKYFANTTRNAICIMGSVTFESLPFLLENRVHVVLTRKTREEFIKASKFHPSHFESIRIVNTPEEAYRCAQNIADYHDRRPIFVIGGTEIYNQMDPFITIWHVTTNLTTMRFKNPTYFRRNFDDFKKLAEMPNLNCDIPFIVTIYKKV